MKNNRFLILLSCNGKTFIASVNEIEESPDLTYCVHIPGGETKSFSTISSGYQHEWLEDGRHTGLAKQVGDAIDYYFQSEADYRCLVKKPSGRAMPYHPATH